MQLLTTEIFSNVWCDQFWANYSTILTFIPGAAFAILQAIAIFHPDVTSNGVFSLVKMWLIKGKNGGTIEEKG